MTRIASLALGAIVAGTVALTGAGCTDTIVKGVEIGVRITEDDARWDCRTMGNRTCGNAALALVTLDAR